MSPDSLLSEAPLDELPEEELSLRRPERLPRRRLELRGRLASRTRCAAKPDGWGASSPSSRSSSETGQDPSGSLEIRPSGRLPVVPWPRGPTESAGRENPTEFLSVIVPAPELSASSARLARPPRDAPRCPSEGGRGAPPPAESAALGAFLTGVEPGSQWMTMCRARIVGHRGFDLKIERSRPKAFSKVWRCASVSEATAGARSSW